VLGWGRGKSRVGFTLWETLGFTESQGGRERRVGQWQAPRRGGWFVGGSHQGGDSQAQGALLNLDEGE